MIAHNFVVLLYYDNKESDSEVIYVLKNPILFRLSNFNLVSARYDNSAYYYLLHFWSILYLVTMTVFWSENELCVSIEWPVEGVAQSICIATAHARRERFVDP